MARKAAATGKFTRKGNHRFECETCPDPIYASIPTVERRGLPLCWCGEPMWPANIETALVLPAEMVADAPIMTAYSAKVSSVAHGQVSHYAKGRELESPEFRALYGDPKDPKRDPGLIAELRQDARRRRVAALVPVPDMPF